MAVQITGLSKRQRALADVLWLMNNRADAERFIASLEPQTQQDALTVVEMMQLAIIDDVDTVDDDVKLMIDNLRY
jgi:hypothetical protein